MAQSWNNCCWQVGLASSLALFGANTPFGDCALAQSNIIPDNTLGNDSSIVLPNSKGAADEVLVGGAQGGANLFHSFQEFNVSEGRRAYFYSPSADIQNILARVTGGNPSKIMGVLGTYGKSEPNLFLINPNGIIFGPNASLDVSGSFMASTARSVLFTDGNQFSANGPQTPPLLTVSVPVGLQFGDTAGDINVQGAFLRVQPGKTLALVGGNLGLEGGYLNAEGGRIEVGSVAGTSQVKLTPTDKGWALGYEDAQNQDIKLSQKAVVNASSGGSGDIQLHGRRITLTDQSGIFANSLSQNGGGISIRALELGVQDGSVVSTTTSGAGQGGNLDVTASESVKLSGTSADGKVASGLFAQTEGSGAAGNLTIATGQLLVQNGAVVSTDTNGAGQGGNLDVTASESVKLSGTSADGKIFSGLFAETKNTGAAGNLRIATRKLLVEKGAAVSSNTSGQEQGGTLDVTASESVKLSGTSANGKVFSGLFAQTEGSGAAGNLKIATGQLLVLDGAVVSASSTSGATGQGGTLDVTASDSVKLSGTSADGKIFSGLYAENLGMGAAGNLKIATGQLQVLDGAVVSASTSSGQGGNITLRAQDLLVLRRGSNISSTAGTANTGGDGGNITIDTPFIVAVPSEDSNITANAFKGKGGFIQITAQGVFGLERSENLTKLGDITAFSQQKPELNGIVEINTPDVEPSRGLIPLPAEPVDVTGLIAQGCSAGGGQGASEFIITGRGGLPPTPRETLSSDTVLEDWGTLALVPTEPLSLEQYYRVSSQLKQKHQRHSVTRSKESGDRQRNSLGDSAVSTHAVRRTPAPLVEAQGWMIGANSEVVLTAQAPTVTPHNPWLTPADCHGTT